MFLVLITLNFFLLEFRIWKEYKKQRDFMLQLIADAETELEKIIPRKSHQQIKDDLVSKQHLREEVKKATEDVLVKMKELSETLASVATAEQQDSFSKEVRCRTQ
jgi:adenylate kinase family enzyme